MSCENFRQYECTDCNDKSCPDRKIIVSRNGCKNGPDCPIIQEKLRETFSAVGMTAALCEDQKDQKSQQVHGFRDEDYPIGFYVDCPRYTSQEVKITSEGGVIK